MLLVFPILLTVPLGEGRVCACVFEGGGGEERDLGSAVDQCSKRSPCGGSASSAILVT
jgi:hypothetical protein